MDPVVAVIAGLIATAVFTGWMSTAPAMGFPNMDMIGLMGTMLTPHTAAAYAVGTAFHFVTGTALAFLYVWLWTRGWGQPTWPWGLAYGAVHGMLSLALLPGLLKVHPRPPRIAPTVGLMLGMILGHLIYGVIVAVTYARMAN